MVEEGLIKKMGKGSATTYILIRRKVKANK